MSKIGNVRRCSCPVPVKKRILRQDRFHDLTCIALFCRIGIGIGGILTGDGDRPGTFISPKSLFINEYHAVRQLYQGNVRCIFNHPFFYRSNALWDRKLQQITGIRRSQTFPAKRRYPSAVNHGRDHHPIRILCIFLLIVTCDPQRAVGQFFVTEAVRLACQGQMLRRLCSCIFMVHRAVLLFFFIITNHPPITLL